MTQYISPPPMNPLSRLLAGILAVLALAAAFFFGFVVLLIFVGAGLIGWLALWVRARWLGRRSGGAGHPKAPLGGADPRATRRGDVIEGEYTVVAGDEDEQDEDRGL
jgi:hypothetical protein